MDCNRTPVSRIFSFVKFDQVGALLEFGASAEPL